MNTEKFISRWEKAKHKGKKKHVLRSGIIMGIATFIGAALRSLADGNSLVFHIHFGYFIGGFIGGIIGGLLNWQRNEEKYNQLVNNNLDK
jgi:hypothetical protein